MIKLRAWHKKTKKIYQVYSVDFLKTSLAYDDRTVLVREDNFNWLRIPKNEVILLQWTGLKDIAGKEIYEGDIVKRKNTQGMIEIGEVKWISVGFNIQNFVHEYGYTIIGNIYENLELLE